MLLKGEIYKLVNFASFPRWFFIALATLGMLIHRYRFPLHPRPFKVRAACVQTLSAEDLVFFTVLYSILSPVGARGRRGHRHGGLFLHRGSVSVFGPLEHRVQLRPHTVRSPSLLCDRLPLPSAQEIQTHIQ